MSTPARRTRNRFLLAAVVAFGLGGLALATAPTGAYFSDSATGTTKVSSGHADVTISDDNHAATCDLDFGVVNPGHYGTATCKVTNTGTTPLNITLSAVGTPTVVAPNGPINPAEYFVAIDDGFLSWTSLTAFSTPVPLGSLNPGGHYTYTVMFKVGENVGNEGEDAVLTNTFTITGTQF